jgi:hypothetical protein
MGERSVAAWCLGQFRVPPGGVTPVGVSLGIKRGVRWGWLVQVNECKVAKDGCSMSRQQTMHSELLESSRPSNPRPGNLLLSQDDLKSTTLSAPSIPLWKVKKVANLPSFHPDRMDHCQPLRTHSRKISAESNRRFQRPEICRKEPSCCPKALASQLRDYPPRCFSYRRTPD